MKVTAMFPSTYLKADDLKGREIRATVDRVVFEEVEEGKADKPVMYFRNGKRGMVINRTNSSTIAEHYGDDTDHWIGKPVILFVMKVDFKGKMVPAIRIRVPVAAPVTSAPQPQRHVDPEPPPFDDAGFDDDPMSEDIPF